MFSLRSKITQAVLGYFMMQDGAAMYVNQIARRFHLESGNLTRKLMELEKDGILTSRWQGTQRYYSLNHSFPLLPEYKKIILKTLGFEYNLKKALQKIPKVKKAIIFGSYAKDKMDTSSDVDLLVVGDHSTMELHKAIAGIQKSIDREINVISMTDSEYRKKRTRDPLLKSIGQKDKDILL